MASPTEALNMLRANPKDFLENYHLMCSRVMHNNGQAQVWFGAQGYIDQSGTEIYNRTPRPGRILGTRRMHDSKNFKFSANHAPNNLEVFDNPVQVGVWHVDVYPSATTNLANIPSLEVSRGGGSDIVITTLLNGCTFLCQPTTDFVRMAHIQPTGGTTSGALETNVRANGIFNSPNVVAGQGAITVFGGGTGYTNLTSDVTVAGSRTAQGRWRVYAQIHTRYTRTITDVIEIFEG
jgi:hypothetical protein